jgi:ribonuclease HI
VVSRLFRQICLLFVFFATQIRLGEAAHPGPHIFGNANPTGLMGKSADLGTLGKASVTVAVQETHLTSQGISKFKKELAWQNTGLHMSHGAPAPPKNLSAKTIGGKQTGVAFLSHYPIRSLVGHWSQEDVASGRCHSAATFVNHRWVTMGTVYGFSERAHTMEVQQNTDRLLAGLTSRVVQGATGLRMVSGDWNLERACIPQADIWENQGWIEAQQLAYLKWNRPQQCTCKRSTVKDYLYLSPEMVPYVQDIQLDWTLFADHAIILVTLTDLDRPPLVPLWRKPKPIDWPSQTQHNIQWESTVQPGLDPDRWYQNIWEDVENYASHIQQLSLQPPLRPDQKGRATTKEVSWQRTSAAPVKPNRRGDVQSELACTNLTHNRWTKQIRRIQHYVRLINSTQRDLNHVEHKASLWRAIRQSTGFSQGFPTWWNLQPKQYPASPMQCPFLPPASDVAELMYQEFLHHYRQLESSLRQARHIHAMQRRVQDPMAIYKDLQKDRAEPVQTIVMNQQIPIQNRHLQEDRMILELAQEIPCDTAAVKVNNIPVEVQVIDEKNLSMPAYAADRIGDDLIMPQLVGNIPDILTAFENEWAPRWQKHDQEDPAKWEPIMSFLKAAIPKREVSFPEITLDQWRHAIAKKKKAAAIGPDGVSRADMLNAPESTHLAMLELIKALEAGHDWPTQAVTGLVAALAKTPQVETVQQYRPICVFSIFYRTWGTIRARQCLRFLQDIVPNTLHGNIPGRSPKKVWYHVQQCIEHAYSQSTELAGGIIDLVKCFNTLPRGILQELAAHIGLPPSVVIPWTNALRQMARRFQVRGSVGKAIFSTCGYAEGCPLSVVAMAICNIAIEVYMYHRFPKVQVYSFVDNIETLVRSTHEAIAAMEVLVEFCQLLDMQVDPSKSYMWSTTPQGRKQITEAAQNKSLFARDLGGHMNYSRLATNSTLQDKIEMFQPFWSRLARSCAPVSQKERSLYVAAWPNLFYGVSTVTLGKNHFLKLRTAATKALGIHQMGSNPMLQLSCVSPVKTDPEFYSIVTTIMSFREFQTTDLVQQVLEHQVHQGRPTPGPCKSFLCAIHKLAWSWIAGDMCRDEHEMPIYILRCPKLELYERIREAWQHRVLALVEAERTTMKNLSQMEVSLTREALLSLPQEHQGLMRCALNGTQYTADALHHANQVESSQCVFCGHQDSLHHRHWECPHFADLRTPVPVLQDLDTSQIDATTCHGWIKTPASILRFRQLLQQISDSSGVFYTPPSVADNMVFTDLFLDGSCAKPTDPFARLATWSVVQWTGLHFWPIAQGGVPGFRQTSLKAEIYAALAAIKYAVESQKPCRLWIDNSRVFKVLSAWNEGIEVPLESSKDEDLWNQLHHQFRHAARSITHIHKVQAHTDASEQTHPLDEWAVQGNQAADKSAAAARALLPTILLATWDKLNAELSELRKLGRELHRYFVAVGCRVMQSTRTPEPAPPAGVTANQTDTCDAGILQLAQMDMDDLPKRFHNEDAEQVMTWIKTLVDTKQPIVWVTFHQLLVDFQIQTERIGLRFQGKQWYATTEDATYSYKKHVAWFSRFMQGIGSAAASQLKIQQCRPSSHVLNFWCGAIQVHFANDRLNTLDSFFRQYAKSLPARQIARDLADLPPGRWPN